MCVYACISIAERIVVGGNHGVCAPRRRRLALLNAVEIVAHGRPVGWMDLKAVVSVQDRVVPSDLEGRVPGTRTYFVKSITETTLIFLVCHAIAPALYRAVGLGCATFVRAHFGSTTYMYVVSPMKYCRSPHESRRRGTGTKKNPAVSCGVCGLSVFVCNGSVQETSRNWFRLEADCGKGEEQQLWLCPLRSRLIRRLTFQVVTSRDQCACTDPASI